MAITLQTSGAVAYSSSTSITPSYPTGIAAGDLLVVFVQVHPNSSTSTISVPSGFTLITGTTTSGSGGGSRGTDTGPCVMSAFAKYPAAGTESGTLSCPVTNNSAGWAQVHRFTAASGSTWDVAGSLGADTTGGSGVSVTGATDPGFTAADYVLGAFGIPTNAATFSAEAFSASGVTFGTITEISEAASALNNHTGGFTAGGPVNSGASTGVPTMTATASGTTTNVHGPGIILRIREVTPGPAGVAISTVGSIVQFSDSASGNTTIHLSVSPTTLGDILVAWGATETAGTITYTGISGGGVTSWTQIVLNATLSTGGFHLVQSMWFGVVTSTGSSTITFTDSGTATTCVAAQQFTAGFGTNTVWSIDGTQTGSRNTASSATVLFPSLTPTNTNRLYVAGMATADTAFSGPTSGYTLNSDPTLTNFGTLWNTSVSTAQSPTVSQTAADAISVAGLIYATGSSSATPRPNLYTLNVPMRRSSLF